ncbi:MAG: TetR/AcrR family transcriptional regulator [Verrucomicrobiales bacterium]|nr:TetR/AcrR family transcriptional regulator [Verrucomicrobiales bacterium]
MELSQQRKPTAVRRVEIANAALLLLAQQGSKAFTTATLAREVGLTSGALFRHFASLDDVLSEAVQQALIKIEATFPDPSLPGIQRLSQLASKRIELIRSEPGLAWILRSTEACHLLPDEALLQLDKMIRRSRSYLLNALSDGASEGSVRTDISPETLLIIVTGTIQSLIGMSGPSHQSSRTPQPKPAMILRELTKIIGI